MSRAFTKEIDDAPVAPAPDRPISPGPNLVTPRGAALIDARMAELDAAVQGGADADDALRRERRYWAARQASMQVQPPLDAPTAIAFGVTADIRRRGKRQTIRIVGEDEADPASGLIGWTSPLAEALDGAEPGDSVEFEAGGRIEQITVLALR